MHQHYVLQEWPEFVNWVHTELSESKQELTQAQETITACQVNKNNYNCYSYNSFQQRDEVNKITISQLTSELSEITSKLMMKEKEVAKLKEDNKLLLKQFRERKDKRRKETIAQVCPY